MSPHRGRHASQFGSGLTAHPQAGQQCGDLRSLTGAAHDRIHGVARVALTELFAFEHTVQKVTQRHGAPRSWRGSFGEAGRREV